MKIKRDQITGLVLIAFGIVIAVLVSQFKKGMTAEYPGPKLFPLIAAFGFVTCGAGIFLTGCFSKKTDEVFLSKEGMFKVIVSFAILCAYVFLMKYFGYIVVTPFVLFALTTLFAWGGGVRTRVWVRVIFAVVLTLTIYVLYVQLFGMTLPRGLIFD